MGKRAHGLMPVAAAAAAALALAGCGGSDLRDNDPDGYEACKMFDDSLGEAGTTALGLFLGVGEIAYRSSNPSIKAATEPQLSGDALTAAGRQLYVTDRVLMRDACERAGYEFDNKL